MSKCTGHAGKTQLAVASSLYNCYTWSICNAPYSLKQQFFFFFFFFTQCHSQGSVPFLFRFFMLHSTIRLIWVQSFSSLTGHLHQTAPVKEPIISTIQVLLYHAFKNAGPTLQEKKFYSSKIKRGFLWTNFVPKLKAREESPIFTRYTDFSFKGSINLFQFSYITKQFDSLQHHISITKTPARNVRLNPSYTLAAHFMTVSLS